MIHSVIFSNDSCSRITLPSKSIQ